VSVQRNYCRTIARELQRYAAWEPGGGVALGDYGALDGSSFLRLGHISEFIDPARLSVQVSTPVSLEFTSTGTTIAMVDADAALAAGQVKSEARLKIGFSRGDAVYMRASRVRTSEISNLRSVTEDLRRDLNWNYDWTLVSNVSTAGRLSLILSVAANTEVSVIADARALRAFNLGAAEASAGLTVVGEAALKMVGAKGPVLFDLVRLRRLLGGTRRAALPGGLALEPYERLVPEDA
jgi:hypothetical protein